MVKTGSHCFVPMSYIFVFWFHFFASETRFFVNLFNGSDLALCFIGPDFEFSMVSIQYFGTFHIIYVGLLVILQEVLLFLIPTHICKTENKCQS